MDTTEPAPSGRPAPSTPAAPVRTAGPAAGTPAAPMGPVSARPAAVLMYLTYAAGAVGAFLGFWGLNSDPASLAAGALVAVGLGGGLSFLRHSIWHRSDAARMRWESGERNNFQLEVGLANLAWAVLAVLAVTLGWGLAAQAASFLVFGLYLVFVAVLLIGARVTGASRPWGSVVAMATFGGVLVVIGVLGMVAA